MSPFRLALREIRNHPHGLIRLVDPGAPIDLEGVGMNQLDSRTIAIEVGLQNGGLASGIALQMGKVATVGLAPAVFGPWMNISGSALANFWRMKPVTDGSDKNVVNEAV